MSAEHTVTVVWECGYPPTYRFACHAPAGALCHADFDCPCETWRNLRVDGDGRPSHTDDAGVRHVGGYGETCNLREWFENGDEPLEGHITFTVMPSWDGGTTFDVVGVEP
jgi:hypothetical protein